MRPSFLPAETTPTAVHQPAFDPGVRSEDGCDVGFELSLFLSVQRIGVGGRHLRRPAGHC